MVNRVSINKMIYKCSHSVKGMRQAAINQKKKISLGVEDGLRKGQRLSNIQHRGAIARTQAKFIGVKRTLPDELFYGAVGTCIPVPFGTIIGIGVAKLIKRLKK